jgi:hypothetical protein
MDFFLITTKMVEYIHIYCSNMLVRTLHLQFKALAAERLPC